VAAAQALEMFKDFKIGGCTLRVRYNTKPRNESGRESHTSIGSTSSNDDVFKNSKSKTPTNGSTSRQNKSVVEEDDDWETIQTKRKPIVSEISDTSVFQVKVKEPTRLSSSAFSDHGSTHSSTDSKLRS